MEAELLQIVTSALEAAGIPYMVTGSVVSAIHGEPRATRDLDLVIDPQAADLEALVAEFPTDRFYIDDAQVALAHRDMFNILDLATGWKADLIIRKDRPFSHQELARRQRMNVAGIEVWVATVEDSILSKLEWYAMSESDRQRRDVIEMLVVNGETLDRQYLEQWAGELGITDELSELWGEAQREMDCR